MRQCRMIIFKIHSLYSWLTAFYVIQNIKYEIVKNKPYNFFKHLADLFKKIVYKIVISDANYYLI